MPIHPTNRCKVHVMGSIVRKEVPLEYACWEGDEILTWIVKGIDDGRLSMSNPLIGIYWFSQFSKRVPHPTLRNVQHIFEKIVAT